MIVKNDNNKYAHPLTQWLDRKTHNHYMLSLVSNEVLVHSIVSS